MLAPGLYPAACSLPSFLPRQGDWELHFLQEVG